jgi:death-on-curing protein
MSTKSDEFFHLTVEIVREIHTEALAQFGGSDGIREPSLLESAVAAPQATFGGVSPFADLTEIAAAYLFYICRNHAFIDGNKRTALGACIVFLRLNGVATKPDSPAWESLTMDVAAAKIDREETTKRLRMILGSRKKATKQAPAFRYRKKRK